MPSTPRKPAADCLPKGLNRAEKKLFREGFEAYFVGADAVSQIEIDTLVDLIRARSRVEILRKLFDTEAREAAETGSYPVDLIPICRQIDSTQRLCLRLADRLEASR